jgi:hypothetical protein
MLLRSPGVRQTSLELPQIPEGAGQSTAVTVLAQEIDGFFSRLKRLSQGVAGYVGHCAGNFTPEPAPSRSSTVGSMGQTLPQAMVPAGTRL